MEYVRKCGVCGKIYCYTDEDLARNEVNSIAEGISAVGTIASLMGGGSMLDSAFLNSQTNKYGGKIVDYTKCPNCNSTRTTIIGTDAGDEQLLKEVEKNKRIATNYFANKENDKIKLEQKGNVQQKEIRKKEIQKNIDVINKKIEEMQKCIKEQNKIIEINKGKIFGAGAKDRKNAEQKIKELNNNLNELIHSKDELEDKLFQEKSFLEIIGMENKNMVKLPAEMNDMKKRIENLVGLSCEEECFVEICSKRKNVFQTMLGKEYRVVDVAVNENTILIHQTEDNITMNYYFNDVAIIEELINPNKKIYSDIKILEYKHIESITYEYADCSAIVAGNIGGQYDILAFLPMDKELTYIIFRKIQEKVKSKTVREEMKEFFSEYEELA